VRISATQAHSGRRAAFATAALCATLLAHVTAGHGVHLLPIAPAIWLGLVSGAALAGPPRSTFRRLGATSVLTGAVALQAAVHVAMRAATWAFGLSVAHIAPLDPGALAAHGAAGLLTAALLLAGKHLLEALSAVARRLARAVPPPAPDRGPPRAHAAFGRHPGDGRPAAAVGARPTPHRGHLTTGGRGAPTRPR